MIGTPREILAEAGGQTRIDILCDLPIQIAALPPVLSAEKSTILNEGKLLTMHTAQPARMIVELVKWIDQQGIGLADIQLKRPTLEDVFIDLTGKRLRE